MAQKVINIRIEEDLKEKFEKFCKSTGMNISVAINMFMTKVVSEQRIPIEISVDPFYSQANQKRLEDAISRLNEGKGTEHQLIEVE
ncbi:MAG: type II toxin-antitoxin system RelB/DinJ family antitoxin [Oscillospiraceae bacterium]|jgi:DNA-damage-inducible protein J|nr:type II toxin-antitoxin system RelB/DinJ family antitoxin [Oscillospiraceae bacterium]